MPFGCITPEHSVSVCPLRYRFLLPPNGLGLPCVFNVGKIR